MYICKCEFCGSKFKTWPNGGRCHACGAPGIVEILNEASKTIATEPLTAKNLVYKETGYRTVTALAWFLTTVLAVSVAGVYLFPEYKTVSWDINLWASFVVIALTAYMGQTASSIVAVVLLVLNFVRI